MTHPKRIEGFIFDVDGCVVRGNKALPGVPEALAALRDRGIRCAFLTNENQRTRAQVVEKLNAMGIPAGVDDVVTAAIVAAEVVNELHPGRKVLAIGTTGLLEALQLVGANLVDREHAAEAEVVVMGKDPDFNQKTLEMVCQAIWNGADFIVTNLDPKVPSANGFMPATGPMIKAVSYATGKEPLVCGKPSKWAGAMALKALGIAPEHGVVVGDALEQDIRMGKEAGLFSVLVLTGATTAQAAGTAPESLRPDLILPDVTHLVPWVDQVAAVERIERESPYILWFERITPDAQARIGGKNASLGEMIRAGIPVPPGFAVTTDAFKKHLSHNHLREKLDSILGSIDTANLNTLEGVSEGLRSLIESCPIPPQIEEDIRRSYMALCDRVRMDRVAVAVRSSATAEDLPGASFAGQQDTFLWITGAEAVLQHVAKCWSSLFTARALSYRCEMGFPHEKVYMSVGVQLMVQPKTAGVAFTLNPGNGDLSKVAIDASWGFGEAVVGGEVTPDNYLVDKVTYEIVKRTVSCKHIEYALDPATNRVSQRPVADDCQNVPCLTDDEIVAIARMARQAEKHYGRPQDVEWVIDSCLPAPDNVVLLQSRPETVWSQRPRGPVTANHQTGVQGVLASLLVPIRIKPKADPNSKG